MKIYKIQIQIQSDYKPRYWEMERHLWHRGYDLPVSTTNWDGTKIWKKMGVIHRDNDKPAYIVPNGTQEWWVNGVKHRNNNKPAIIYTKDACGWWENGKFIKGVYL